MLLVVRFGTATLSEGKGFRCVMSQSVPFGIWAKTSSCAVILWGNQCSVCAQVYSQIHIFQSRLFTVGILWQLPHSHMDIYPSAKMYFSNTFTQRSKQYVNFIILSQCTADQAAIHSLSPLWVCQSYQEPCFYLTWGSLKIHNLLFPALQICCSLLFFPCLSLLWAHFSFSWSFLFRSCLFLIAPVASLLLLVAVMIWFSHFPICCNNFILSHLKEAYRQAPRLMCEQKTRREMMHCSHRLTQALCRNQRCKSNGMEMGWRGSWVWYEPRRERGKQEGSETNPWAGAEPSGACPPADKPPPTPRWQLQGCSGGFSGSTDPASISWRMGCTGHREGSTVQSKFWTQNKEDKANE